MELAEVEEATRLHQRGRDLRPATDVGQPVERAEAGVDDVEAPSPSAAAASCTSDGHELRIERPPRPRVRAGLDRRAEKSSPVTSAPTTGPGQRVEAEVALEVDQRAPGHVADLLELERAQRVRAGHEAPPRRRTRSPRAAARARPTRRGSARSGAQRELPRALAEAQLDQQLAHLGAHHRLAVEALDAQARHAAAAHGVGQRLEGGPQPALVRLRAAARRPLPPRST